MAIDIRDSRPMLGITMGDPSGNGPEISVKALMDPAAYEKCRPVIIGDAVCMEYALTLISGAEKLTVHRITDYSSCLKEDGIDLGGIFISYR